MAKPVSVLIVDVTKTTIDRESFKVRQTCLGGVGLAAYLYSQYGKPEEEAFHPDQPLCFAIGPLTGFYPMMSKMVLGFKSPYNGQYAETHAGGRSALALKFSGYDALVVKGQASSLSCLLVGAYDISIVDVHYLQGMDIFATGKLLRKIQRTSPGHRSILRIGPAGENRIPLAGINVDTYRHFGRLGAGAVMGAKNLKGIVLSGDMHHNLEEENIKEYRQCYHSIHKTILETSAVKKYHDLGTAQNIIPLNTIQSLPWRNLQATSDAQVNSLSGETFAQECLLRQVACAGCPVGCIHVGLLRQRFGEEHEYLYRQVAYDYEPLFATGSMLGMTQAPDIFVLIEDIERMGLDVISTGVALAWATEALEKGIISLAETGVSLEFGQLDGYRQAILSLAHSKNRFYTLLGQGLPVVCQRYGGFDFACVLGQEMAGYATGETYFVSQALGFRHSHLDTGAYAFDQESKEQDIDQALKFLIEEEQDRILLCSLVGCLFGRKAYPPQTCVKALNAIGYSFELKDLWQIVQHVQKSRWRLKLQTGYDPRKVSIPRRFLEVVNWKGPINADYLNELKERYSQAILSLASSEERDV